MKDGIMHQAWGLTGLLVVLTGLVPMPAADDRADDYVEALAKAKATGRDIVVFQRGSDWNRLGEMLYRDVWSQEAFARELGDGFVLVAVDRPEQAGNPPLPAGGVPAPDAPGRRLVQLVDEKAPLPPNEVTAVASAGAIPFAPRPDGAFLGTMTPHPAQDTLTLRLKPQRGGRILRLDFPADPSLPGGGAGRGAKGNFAISEIVVREGDRTLAIDAAWANGSDGGWGAWQAIDGIADQPDNAWNPGIRKNQSRTLLLTMTRALPAGAEVAVELICRSQWKQHLPGCVRAAVLAEAGVEADVRACAEAQRKMSRNVAAFTWWDGTICPRIALMDSQGRAVACENRPRLGLTPATLAARVKELRAVRERRDALWAKAEAAQGPLRAELLRQGLDLMGFANWPGNDKCYAPIHERIRAADPKDASGAVRWLGFGGDPRDGVPWAEPRWSQALEKKEPAEADFQEALARIDRELKDPRNQILDHERIQRIMIARYLVYSRWPKHEEQRFDVQREIAAFDPDTFWGIGARGDLGLRHRSATPMLSYGWAASQVKSGANTWDMADTAYLFDHAGPYRFRLTVTGGKDALTIRRIALLDGATVLAEARPAASLTPAHAVEVDLDFAAWRADRAAVLRVEADAADGRTDSAGSFTVEPQLLAPPALARHPARTDETSRMLERIEVSDLQQRLEAALAAELGQGGAGLGRLAQTPALQMLLAQVTLIRLCGVETLEGIATREGGAAFLQSLFQDAGWLESFLASGTADWPQAIGNLAALARHGAGWELPFNQRLATALALQWGNGSRYRLVDRFRHIQQALRDGLMHVSVEGLDVRELRWAVPTYGTARDFQFLLDDRQTRLREYLGAHAGVRYVSFNVYGVSVQDQWNYIAPWAHVHGNGMGNRPFPAHRQVGGVCGTVSTYASAAAQVHGIPSVAIGQPRHCAFVVRVGQEWQVGNSVTWPSYTSVPGWDGAGYSTLRHLYEAVNQDRGPFLAATRLGWLADFQADRIRPRVRILPGLRYRLYRQGVGAALPDFSSLTVDRSGACQALDLAAIQGLPAENVAVAWDGAIEVVGAGPLRISTQSDDGSRVLIDGAAVVEANCNRQEKVVTLAPGRHRLRVEFCQGGGAMNLKVGFEGQLAGTAGDWMRTYEQAIQAQPTNYGTWLACIRTLESAAGVPTATWRDLGRRAAGAFAICNEAGLMLSRRCLEKALPEMKPAERMELLLACGQDLRQEDWYKPEVFPYDGMLDWQAEQIGDRALGVEFFRRLLTIHHSARPDCSFIFGNVLSWGAKRFAGDAKTAPAFAQAMETFFRTHGPALGGNLLATTLQSGIRKASETRDIVSFRMWNDMAERMLPALQPADVHLNAQQAAVFPRYEPFPGDLLSREGMLLTSSAHPDDRPLSYRQILSGGFGGWLDASGDEKTWARVELAGEGELSGIILVNRYEAKPAELQKAVPLKISVSMDGSVWTEVASFDKAEAVFRVDLQGRKLLARHVRAERLPAAGEGKTPERFALRGFLVYGKKHY